MRKWAAELHGGQLVLLLVASVVVWMVSVGVWMGGEDMWNHGGSAPMAEVFIWGGGLVACAIPLLLFVVLWIWFGSRRSVTYRRMR